MDPKQAAESAKTWFVMASFATGEDREKKMLNGLNSLAEAVSGIADAQRRIEARLSR